MSYSSIIINNGIEEPDSPIGLTIPNILDDIEKNKKYVLQFAIRNLNNTSTVLDHIYVGPQKLDSIDITDYETILLDDESFYNCFIPFTSLSNMVKPEIKIGRIKTASEESDIDILEITRLKLCRGETLTEYTFNDSDILILKHELYTKIQQLSDVIVLKAKKEDVDRITNEISDVLGQIQVEAGKIELKVDNDGIVSSINMSKEGIKINTDLLDLSGDLELQGEFKCWKDSTNKTGDYLYMHGGMLYGYNEKGGDTPVYASGLWTDDSLGYYSVGYTRADKADINGCLYMSPQHANAGCRLVYAKLKAEGDADAYNTELMFNRDGSLNFVTNLYENRDNASGYPYNFDSGITTPRCKSQMFTSGLNNISMGTVGDDGAFLGYGPLIINTVGGYAYPKTYAGMTLGTQDNPFYNLYTSSSPVVVSDARRKTDIHYLNEPIEHNNLIEDENPRMKCNMNITTSDFYDFIKNDLNLASYRYKVNLERNDTSVDYGFVAQDILFTKVGSEIVRLADKSDLDSGLAFNQGNYITAIVGALQEEIAIRDQQIEELENRLKKIEQFLGWGE